MSMTRARRPIPIALTALVVFISALAALAVSNAQSAGAHGGPSHDHHAALTRKEAELHDGMRKLWEDHIVWTRLAIISLTTDAPDTEATVGRLLQNQTDIGDAVKPFYGAAAGDELTRQLRLHILIAAEVINAAKAGDAAKLADAQARWRANADDIAGVLASVNPRFWKLETMKEEMQTHLELTTEEVVARLQANWDADVAAYDRVHEHILHMADLLSNGIVKQFPKRFH
jgi:hypothetical protein